MNFKAITLFSLLALTITSGMVRTESSYNGLTISENKFVTLEQQYAAAQLTKEQLATELKALKFSLLEQRHSSILKLTALFLAIGYVNEARYNAVGVGIDLFWGNKLGMIQNSIMLPLNMCIGGFLVDHYVKASGNNTKIDELIKAIDSKLQQLAA